MSLPNVGRYFEAYLAVIVIVMIITIPLSSYTYVQQGFGQESTTSETLLSGENLDLTVMPALPINQATEDQNMIVLSFNAKADQFGGSSVSPGKIDHLDYSVAINKDGNELWNEQFHDHDGNLELQISPSSSGEILVEGGAEDVGKPSTDAYTIQGPLLVESGEYDIVAEIVGIEFNPLPSPISDTFNVQVS